MANEEQLAILKQGVQAWNQWRKANPEAKIDLERGDLAETKLGNVNFTKANLAGANFSEADLTKAHLMEANLSDAELTRADLSEAELILADLSDANLLESRLNATLLVGANLSHAYLIEADLTGAHVSLANFTSVRLNTANLSRLDLSEAKGLERVRHAGPSSISTDTFVLSKGRIPGVFLRGCGLSDWEIEAVNLYNPDLNNHEINDIQYRVYDLRASQALQISPLFVSYSHADSHFVDRIGKHLNEKRVRYWRDIHDMKAGKIEKQIDRAIRQNPTVLLVLSEHSLNSDWVEHEVRTARDLAKELGHDTLCPVALDNSWKSSRWPQRVMEQIMEYNILDFSAWQDDSKFDGTFRKLIDGLELFYKG